MTIDPHKLEILKMAREIVSHEYENTRADDHNKWLAKCDTHLRTTGMKLPYPEFPKFPTEDVIIERAQKMLDFLKSDKPEAPAKVVAKNALRILPPVEELQEQE